MTEPMIDAEATAELFVAEGDLATSLKLGPDEVFPPVFATSRMIALMELAAARLLRPHTGSGERSVGVSIEVTHSAATPQDAWVVAKARYLGREGKLFAFEVVARDSGGEIGRGFHKRAIVSVERLIGGAERRCGNAGLGVRVEVP